MFEVHYFLFINLTYVIFKTNIFRKASIWRTVQEEVAKLRRKVKKLRKAGLMEKNKIRSLLAMISIVALMMAGCGDGLSELSESGEIVVESEVYPSGEDNFDDAESIAAELKRIMAMIPHVVMPVLHTARQTVF